MFLCRNILTLLPDVPSEVYPDTLILKHKTITMKRFHFHILIVAAFSILLCAACKTKEAKEEKPPVIPVETFFKNPENKFPNIEKEIKKNFEII
jgi:hypothetical protein